LRRVRLSLAIVSTDGACLKTGLPDVHGHDPGLPSTQVMMADR